jgi:integrase
MLLDEELIQINPVSSIIKHLNIGRSSKLALKPMSHEDIAKFLEICLEYYPNYYPFFLTAFRTGMRLGELIALEWGDINWSDKFIQVNKSYNNMGIVGPTKSGKERWVDMSDTLYTELSNLAISRKKEAYREGKGDYDVKMIFHRNDTYMEQKYIRRVFKRILRKTGFQEMRFHDVRHTFASLLLTDGVSPVYVKELMGHHSIKVTVDTYGHLIPGSNRDAINKLDNAPKRTLYAPIEKL